ncbi:zinc dependent phospholipase C family protein [Thermodesulfovibrio hydrogeniphilus]
MIVIFLFILVFFYPETSYAWGPLSHAYLAQQTFNFIHLIPISLVPLINNYQQYFIYGNLLPDVVIGKKYLPESKNPHSWKTGLNLLEDAKTPEEQAFAYGFLTHLAADAVLHKEIKDLNPLQHMIFELKADRMVDRLYWLQIMAISKRVKKVSDRFFEQSIVESIPTMKTSKKIYKSLIFLSGFNFGELKDSTTFENLHVKSLNAMLDILNYGKNSDIIRMSPNH